MRGSAPSGTAQGAGPADWNRYDQYRGTGNYDGQPRFRGIRCHKRLSSAIRNCPHGHVLGAIVVVLDPNIDFALHIWFFDHPVFLLLGEQERGCRAIASPRLLGLALVATGILAIVLGTFEHMARIKTLREAGLPGNVQFFLPLGSAAVFLFIGIVALVAIVMNWHF